MFQKLLAGEGNESVEAGALPGRHHVAGKIAAARSTAVPAAPVSATASSTVSAVASGIVG